MCWLLLGNTGMMRVVITNLFISEEAYETGKSEGYYVVGIINLVRLMRTSPMYPICCIMGPLYNAIPLSVINKQNNNYGFLVIDKLIDAKASEIKE